LICPICKKRKAKRFCPGRTESICSQCCGTERETTIDCPSNCPHLIASRQYDFERKETDWSKAPFKDTRLQRSFVTGHAALIDALSYRICTYAGENRVLVDSDVQAALERLAETYRTLSSGIYYENPPDYHYQRELYEQLKGAIADWNKAESQRIGITNMRDDDVRSCLVFLAQLCFARSNGRPKGRAFLDVLRSQFKSEELAPRSSNILLLS
jgi:hypothetical protein